MTADEARAYIEALPETFDVEAAHRADSVAVLGQERAEKLWSDGHGFHAILLTGMAEMESAALGQPLPMGYNDTAHSRCCWTAAKRLVRYLDEHPEQRGRSELLQATHVDGVTFADLSLTPIVWGWAQDAAEAIIAGQDVVGPLEEVANRLGMARARRG